MIGNGNVFECYSRVEAQRIGNYNVFGAKCHVMAGAQIGNGCVIGSRVMVIQNKKIKDCLVVFGDNMQYEQPLMKKVCFYLLFVFCFLFCVCVFVQKLRYCGNKNMGQTE